ncbi:MAG: hypothetical protein GF344_03100 [Chitinivibrionales bacterium]|nr:hypothetical protein [Chitinivibrionales bacterium]MBD3356066.1 hypothetical protein [Chitinivibrionales bacterium]
MNTASEARVTECFVGHERENGNIDVLILSRSEDLMGSLLSNLRGNDPPYIAYVADGLAELRPLDASLAKCRLIICDIDSDPTLLHCAATALEKAPFFPPVIACGRGGTFPPTLAKTSDYQRLCGVVDTERGWNANWSEIRKIWWSWTSPVMGSRIEDVSSSDVLQMIGVGGWTAVVKIDGKPTGPRFSGSTVETIRGCIWFNQGRPEFAWSSLNTGLEAVYDLLSVGRGVLWVVRPTWNAGIRNLWDGIQETLIAYAVSVDECQAEGVEDPEGVETNDRVETALAAPLYEESLKEEDPEPCWGAQSDEEHHIPLDHWWHACSPGVAETIRSSPLSSLPSRRMESQELHKLINTAKGARFLVLQSLHREWLIKALSRLGRNLRMNISVENRFPVVRVGRFGGETCYVTGFDDAGGDSKALAAYPWILLATPQEIYEALNRLTRQRPALIIILTNDADGMRESLADYDGTLPLSSTFIEFDPSDDASLCRSICDAVELLAHYAE